MAAVAAPAMLLALTQRIEKVIVVGAGMSVGERQSSTRSRAGHVIRALDALGRALVRSGVSLASRTGLGRVLEWQYRLHGDVVHLVSEPHSLSPAMATGPP